LRLKNDRKGQVRVIEAFFASLLLMSCLALIPAQPNLQNSTGDLSSSAQNILLSLDSNGHLATLIDNRDWTGLKSCVESALPLTLWFNLTVFDTSMNCLHNYPISNAGAVSDKIVSLDYVCASQSGTFAIYILRLQLAEVD
jgi:hypothetical protein